MASPEMVFDFHTDPQNLLKITPSNLAVTLETSGPTEVGQTISINVKHLGLFAMTWKVMFTSVDRPTLLVDEQISGPFQYWKQIRTFTATNSGTLLTDVVEYCPPFGLLGRVADALVVKRQVSKMFRHRQKKTKALIESLPIPLLD